MSSLRYVCLSDLHIGQDQSILTNVDGTRVDASKPSVVLTALVECLRDVIGKLAPDRPPTLILLGDAVELALTDSAVSGAAFERFAELWVRDGRCLFDRVIYVPGNHDHHVWSTVRDGHHIEQLRAGGPEPARVRHTTPLTAALRGDRSLPGAVMQRALGALAKDVPLDIHYPSLAVHAPASDRVALFTHGHFFEPLYHLMSSLDELLFPADAPPATAELMERENFGWIDFFWSMMGRQGRVGEHVEVVYDSLAFPAKEQAIVKRLVDGLIAKWGANEVEKFVTRKSLEWVVAKLVAHTQESDRKQAPSLLGEATQQGMRSYVEGPLRRQVQDELGAVPHATTLVFGHTHKPFETGWQFAGYPGEVQVYNTGGWAIDPARAVQPLHGGAAVLLDDDLNAASLRLFNEQIKPEAYAVRVAAAGDANPWSQRVTAAIDPAAAPYARFSELAAAQVAERFALVNAVLGGADPRTND